MFVRCSVIYDVLLFFFSFAGKPVITEYVSDIAVRRHTNATITFAHYSNDGSTPNVKWYKVVNDVKQRVLETDSKILRQTYDAVTNVDFYSISVPLQGQKSRLQISNVQDNDIGVYTVEIENTVGSAEGKRTRLVYIGK